MGLSQYLESFGGRIDVEALRQVHHGADDGTVIGMMPHAENMIEPIHSKVDCRPLFEGLQTA